MRKDADAPPSPAGVLEAVARACSPRVACFDSDTVLFDADGLSRVCGPPSVIVAEVQKMAAAQGIPVRVALADTMTAAWVLGHARAGLTVVPAGAAREALADIPIGWLGTVFDLDGVALRLRGTSASPASVEPRRGRRGRGGNFRVAPPPPSPQTAAPWSAPTVTDRQLVQTCRDRLATLARWGIRTCADLARLPRADLHARMGPVGVRLHQAALGEDVVPLVPAEPARVFADRLTLEWPIEDLEPLAFVLARQCERLSADLEQADRGAVALHTTLTLVTRDTHVRSLTLPAPLRDARVLRTLILLDLESHPPPAAIDVVEIRVDVTLGRILQGSLLSLAVPTAEDLSTLLARLGALMGETRIGAPVCVDTHDSRQITLAPFRLPAHTTTTEHLRPPSNDVRWTLRRFRLPLAARVMVDHGTPIQVWPNARELAGGQVRVCAGPWRTSGAWWTHGRAHWDRDEWDAELADGVVYRLTRIRASGAWEIEGIFD